MDLIIPQFCKALLLSQRSSPLINDLSNQLFIQKIQKKDYSPSFCLCRAKSMAAPLQSPSPPALRSGSGEEYANVKWEELGFTLTPTDYMYVAKCQKGDTFTEGKIVPYGDINMSPCSAILNYGQGLFEGLKAYRTEDGRIMLFRPDQNALRMEMGAERLCLVSPSVEFFVDAVKQTVLANKKWVPPPGKGTLYIRPLLMGSGPTLGLVPAPEYTFLVYVSPVGSYHNVDSGLHLKIDHKNRRAHLGGTGGVKSSTNYSPVLKTLLETKSSGFSDVLFLDAATGRNIEEVSSCNIFVVKGNTVSTPATSGTILPGITRKSIIDLARDFGYEVEERIVPMEELLDADEVFCAGTAVVVRAVETITFEDKKIEYKTGPETLSTKLFATLTGIQTGRIEDTRGWMVEVDGC